MAVRENNNPYAVPAVPIEMAESTRGLWRVEGVGILIQDGAVLPPIDLETGGGQPPFVERKWKMVKNHWSINCMGLGVIPLQFVYRHSLKWGSLPFWLPPVVLGGAWMIIILLINFTLREQIIFTTFCDPAREAQRKKLKNIRAAAYAAGCALLLVPVFVTINNPLNFHLGPVLGSMIPGIISMLAIAFWQYHDRPQIHLSWENDNHVRLAGANLRALQHLEQWQATRSWKS